MAVPLGVAGPAALLAAGAWLTARGRLDCDYTLIKAVLSTQLYVRGKAKLGRLSFFLTLEEHALDPRSSNRLFLMYEGRSWSYKEAYGMILKYGAWLKTKYGVEAGEFVAMDLANSPNFIFLWFGLWSIGAVPAFINYNLTGQALLHSITVSGARITVVDEEHCPNITPDMLTSSSQDFPANGQSKILAVLDAETEQEILGTIGDRGSDSIFRNLLGSDTAILISTSGTTGFPKSAIISWRKLWMGAGFLPNLLNINHADRYYTCMPLYHSTAAVLGLIPVLANGSTLVLGRKFSTKTFWKEVRQHNATIIQYVGETCRYLLAAPPQIEALNGANLDRAHNVRAAVGNGLRPDVWERFKSRFGIETIAEFYGMTEGPNAFFNLSNNTYSSGAIARHGSISSQLLKTVAPLVVIDWDTELPERTSDGRCIRAKTGERGELLMKLPTDIKTQYQGYYNNLDATESKILRDVLVKGDVYFRTGDILRFDNEGRWWFCDRMGDTFRWKSENVSTAEVSEVLGRHPHVLDANVYGVEVPHHDGRIGCGAVLLADNQTSRLDPVSRANMTVDAKVLEELASHTIEQLPSYAVPGFLRVVSQVVATGNNKQQKNGLRQDGVNPDKVGSDQLYWLRGRQYVRFDKKDWEGLKGGQVKL